MAIQVLQPAVQKMAEFTATKTLSEGIFGNINDTEAKFLILPWYCVDLIENFDVLQLDDAAAQPCFSMLYICVHYDCDLSIRLSKYSGQVQLVGSYQKQLARF